MKSGKLNAWLDTVCATKPFTVADAKELHKLIKISAPEALVDVYTTKGDVVHVRVETERGVLTRDLRLV